MIKLPMRTGVRGVAAACRIERRLGQERISLVKAGAETD